MSYKFYDKVEVYPPTGTPAANDVVIHSQLDKVKTYLEGEIGKVSGNTSDVTDLKNKVNGINNSIENINTRLNELGFKSRTITIADGKASYGSGLINKMGKCVYCSCSFTGIDFREKVDSKTSIMGLKYFMTKKQVDELDKLYGTVTVRKPIIVLPEGYRPTTKTTVSIFIIGSADVCACQVEIDTRGEGWVIATTELPLLTGGGAASSLKLDVYLNFGFTIE